jgi:hypothetical protein
MYQNRAADSWAMAQDAAARLDEPELQAGDKISNEAFDAMSEAAYHELQKRLNARGLRLESNGGWDYVVIRIED